MAAAVPTGRTVSIVVLEDGATRALEPFEVDTPWWSDVAPITAARPGLAVLRLLDGTPAPGSRVGGHVTYLAEPLGGPFAVEGGWPSHAWLGVLAEDRLRLPWARPGGPAADLEWAAQHVPVIAPPEQVRTWNLSSIWRVPTRDGDVWLKCVPPFSSHEPAVLGALVGHPVPHLLAAAGHRELLEGLPGVDGYDATLEERRALIATLVAIQVWSIGRTDDLLSAGVPDRGASELLALGAEVVARVMPDDPDLKWLIETGAERAAAIAACGLTDVLVHGDAHPGNARIGPGAGSGIWFDWGDARIAHPLIDLAVLERPGTTHRDELVAFWLDRWRDAVPGSEPERAWRLVRPLAALGDAVVYQCFVDHIEDSERVYHRDDVAPCLALAARLAAAGRQDMA